MSVIVKIASPSDHLDLPALRDLINTVYTASEGSLWVENHLRVSTDRLNEIFERQELIVALEDNKAIGCIHLEKIDKEVYKFKMVAVAFKHKRKGVGSKLVDFAEQQAISYGAKTMQLELLVPETAAHPDKVILEQWYTNIGYKEKETQSVDYCHDGLGQFLITPSKAVVYRKPLIL